MSDNNHNNKLKLSLLLTPPNDHHLKLASQIGVSDIVLPYPGTDLNKLLTMQNKCHQLGLNISVIERHLPHHHIVHGTERDQQINDIKTLIQNMGKAKIDILCYNWMPRDDWARTNITEKERGNALVTSFDENEQKLMDMDGTVISQKITTADELWKNLKYFLEEIIPECEKNNVTLALHPDDPPLDIFQGNPQIVHSYEAMLKVMDLVKSPANGICFCQGTFASAGLDIPKGIAQLSKYIKFVHFRDVNGKIPYFVESFVDNGKTNMVECIKAYQKYLINDVPIRPDHVPTLDGESNELPGYHNLGRLHAIGYMKGIIDAVLN